MPKTPKIHALTATLKCHVQVDPGDMLSLHNATDAIEGLRRYAAELGQTTIETRLNRVPAPEPEPATDELDTPDNLRRGPKPAAT